MPRTPVYEIYAHDNGSQNTCVFDILALKIYQNKTCLRFMSIINNPAYLRDAQNTSYELQLPPETVWQDGSEWRLVSYLAFDAAKVKKQFAPRLPFDAIAKSLVPLDPKRTELTVGKKRVFLVYAQPYAPLLQTAIHQLEWRHWQKLVVGSGQLLVNLPAAPVTYLFWKRDVIQFKCDEQAAAKGIYREMGIKYRWNELPPGHLLKQKIQLKTGPSWRWWTKYLNEFETGVEWPPLWEGVDHWRPSIEGLGGHVISNESLKRCPKISKWPRRYQGKLIGSLQGILGWPGFQRLRSPEGIQFLKLLDSLSRTDLTE